MHCLVILERKGRRTRSLAVFLVQVRVQNKQVEAKQKFKKKFLKRMIILKEVTLCITAYLEVCRA